MIALNAIQLPAKLHPKRMDNTASLTSRRLPRCFASVNHISTSFVESSPPEAPVCNQYPPTWLGAWTAGRLNIAQGNCAKFLQRCHQLPHANTQDAACQGTFNTLRRACIQKVNAHMQNFVIWPYPQRILLHIGFATWPKWFADFVTSLVLVVVSFSLVLLAYTSTLHRCPANTTKACWQWVATWSFVVYLTMLQPGVNGPQHLVSWNAVPTVHKPLSNFLSCSEYVHYWSQYYVFRATKKQLFFRTNCMHRQLNQFAPKYFAVPSTTWYTVPKCGDRSKNTWCMPWTHEKWTGIEEMWSGFQCESDTVKWWWLNSWYIEI